MKRPIIKGTPLHKASIAKAKAESIVSQARGSADRSLVKSGELLGESYIPAAIDFSIDRTKPNLTKKDLDDALKNPRVKKVKKQKVNKNKEKVVENKSEVVAKEVPKVEDKKKDVLIGNTESADSKYVSPYIEEEEDEDNDYSGIENDKSGDGDEGTNDEFVYKPYENWKVKEEKRLLKEAEELKARSDAKSRARSLKVSKIKPKNVEQIPNTAPETKIEQAGPAPASKPGKGKAHENPNYEVAKPQYDSEGNQTSTGGVASGGYNYQVESDQWTYNGIPIESYEVPEEYVDSVDEDIEKKQAAKKDKDLNANTPSSDSTTVDLLPQPQANTTVSTNTEQTLTPRQIREKKRADKKYNDPSTGPNVKAQMIKEGYVPNESKSAAQMRDNRIYRNAKPNGQVRKNMMKGGYTPN